MIAGKQLVSSVLYGVVDRNINFSTLSISFFEERRRVSSHMLFSTLSVARPLDTLLDFNQSDITRIIPIMQILFSLFSFTTRHRKSFYNNRNEIKKGKKKSNKNCLNINNFFIFIFYFRNYSKEALYTLFAARLTHSLSLVSYAI